MSPAAVDKGWSWFVCAGSAVAMFLESGLIKSLGVLLPVLRQQFVTKTWIIGFAISILPGFGTLTCPLAGGLSKLYTARYTVMAFGCVATLGLISGSCSTSIPALVVSFVLASFVIGGEAIVLGELASYFDKHYRVANSLCQIGGSVGIMLLPLLTQFFIDVYGWQNSLLLLGALMTHLIICGAVLRPLAVTHDAQLPSTKQTSSPEHKASLLQRLAYCLDLKVFNNMIFLAMLWFQFGNGYCFTGWCVYLVPYALDIGLPLYTATALATYGGFGSLLGNTMHPLVTKILSVNQIFHISTVVCSVAFVAYPVFSYLMSYAGLIIATIAFGCARGMTILCCFQILKASTVAEESRTNAIMWFNVAFSLGSMAGGFLTGWVYDQRGSYDISFIIISLISTISAVPQATLDIRRKWKDGIYSPLSTEESSIQGNKLTGLHLTQESYGTMDIELAEDTFSFS